MTVVEIVLTNGQWRLMMKIKLGTNYIVDYEDGKMCNLCEHFVGYGLHACSGHCFKLNKDISGGYVGNYRTTAKECSEFSCKKDYLILD